MERPPLIQRLAYDPILGNVKLIAEAWDAGGMYQVGNFPAWKRWAEWNGKYRDDIRSYLKGDIWSAPEAVKRITGSLDLYGGAYLGYESSVNFLTCHDGFTLYDLYSYNNKHNEDNGWNNTDGANDNRSWNCGVEGETDDPAINDLRFRMMRNAITVLMCSRGTPMIYAGDEFANTQFGNNNAYCQDNEISWIDWTLKDKYKDVFEFVRKAVAFRKKHPALRRPEFFTGRDISLNSMKDITWYDELGESPDWTKLDHFLAFRLDGSRAEIISNTDDNDFFLMMNSSTKDVTVTLPPPGKGKKWLRCVDTSVEAPNDFLPENKEEMLEEQNVYVLPARSFAILLSR